MSIYERLGVKPIINANASATRLGGSLFAPPVIDAMREASQSFVDMYQLQEAVSRRVAELTRNEDAFVCAGAAAGLVLGTLACMSGSDMGLVARLHRHGAAALPRHEVIIHCGSRNPYDLAINLAGAQIIQIGNVWQTLPWELEGAISERTAAVLYLPGPDWGKGALPLDQVLDTAHARGVPVIVDAAAQLPPAENLWRFTQQGADLAVFSGGKRIQGPQSTGILVGKRELIGACSIHASPHEGLGRPMKVGKEELVGLLVALEWFLEQDQDAATKTAERITQEWIDVLNGLPGVTATRDFPGESGRLIPRAIVEFAPALGYTSEEIRMAMLDGEPAIDTALAGERSIYLNAETLEPGEDVPVLRKLCSIAARPHSGSKKLKESRQ